MQIEAGQLDKLNETERKKKLDQLFRRAEDVFKQRFPEGLSLSTKDDLTALCVAHMSNYLPEVVPEANPFLARLVSLILDLEIVWDITSAKETKASLTSSSQS